MHISVWMEKQENEKFSGIFGNIELPDSTALVPQSTGRDLKPMVKMSSHFLNLSFLP